jgi:hypothetical protein
MKIPYFQSKHRDTKEDTDQEVASWKTSFQAKKVQNELV